LKQSELISDPSSCLLSFQTPLSLSPKTTSTYRSIPLGARTGGLSRPRLKQELLRFVCFPLKPLCSLSSPQTGRRLTRLGHRQGLCPPLRQARIASRSPRHCPANTAASVFGESNMSRDTREHTPRKSRFSASGTVVERHLVDGESCAPNPPSHNHLHIHMPAPLIIVNATARVGGSSRLFHEMHPVISP
jgi:hypothetical protein